MVPAVCLEVSNAYSSLHLLHFSCGATLIIFFQYIIKNLSMLLLKSFAQ